MQELCGYGTNMEKFLRQLRPAKARYCPPCVHSTLDPWVGVFWRAMSRWSLRFTLLTNAKDAGWLVISAGGVVRLESRYYFWLVSNSLCSWGWPWILDLPVSMSWNCWCEPGLWFSPPRSSLFLLFCVCVAYVNICVQGCMPLCKHRHQKRIRTFCLSFSISLPLNRVSHWPWNQAGSQSSPVCLPEHRDCKHMKPASTF